VINGDIERKNAEDGGMTLVFKSVPRLIINEVETKIGEPITFVEAFAQNKYEDISTKYNKNYFDIPY
jgi:hypothetical protein